ncbi:MAG: SDR family NAD(P)-dependent oxidoreductase [Bacteroidales bacterium]|nr:SDR family NAD(P)-dependent oxidoreductase [Bacteroidales bacterium]MCB9000196.1 SDR family NAD(P)-dependent oxidoreductase [Bacteroidales bacterium]
MNSENTFALITGASSGIGKAIAWYCGSIKMNLLLVSLPNENLESVAKEIAAKYQVRTDYFETDLSELNGPESVYIWVQEMNYNVNLLVNNAGIAGTSVFETSSPEYNDKRIMVNIRALVLLTRYFLPELKKHSEAYILNVGSLSAFFSIPYKAVYSASKSFVVNFSRALHSELRGSTVHVSVVCPNGVRTNAGTHGRIEAHGAKGRLTSVPLDLLAKKSVEKMLSKKFLYIPLGINRFLLLVQKIIPVRLQQNLLLREFNKEVRVS